MNVAYRFDEEFERPTVHLVWFLVEVEGIYQVCLFGCLLIFRCALREQLSEVRYTRHRIARRKLLLYLATLNRVDLDLFDDLFIKVCFLLELDYKVSNRPILGDKELIRFLHRC